jgi:putative FmdB family regulatory protein
MPIYEYTCRDCGTNFEELLLSAKETVSCRSCRSKKVERHMSTFNSPASQEAGAKMGGGCGCMPSTCGCH